MKSSTLVRSPLAGRYAPRGQWRQIRDHHLLPPSLQREMLETAATCLDVLRRFPSLRPWTDLGPTGSRATRPRPRRQRLRCVKESQQLQQFLQRLSGGEDWPDPHLYACGAGARRLWLAHRRAEYCNGAGVGSVINASINSGVYLSEGINDVISESLDDGSGLPNLVLQVELARLFHELRVEDK